MKRSNLLLITAMVVVLVAILAYVTPAQKPKAEEPQPTPQEFSEDLLWNDVQNWRTSQNLPQYIKNDELCEVAADRADDGLDYHKGFMEKYNNFKYVMQENDVYGNSGPTPGGSSLLLLQSWLNSPPHHATLLKPWKYSCIKCFHYDCAQVFSNLDKKGV